MVKSTSENALKNKKKKKPGRSQKRSGSAGTTARNQARVSPSGNKTAARNVIFLVGFMGAGKSSVGRALGERLNWVFEDLDDRIERRANRKVADIFRDSGEPEFRRAEYEALQEVLQELRGGVSRIVALGGGAFVQDKNAKLLRGAGVTTLFLDAPVEELWDRCCRQAGELGAERPLHRSKDQFHELYQTRRKKYSGASFRVETGGLAVDTIADEIVQRLKLKSIEIRKVEGEVE